MIYNGLIVIVIGVDVDVVVINTARLCCQIFWISLPLLLLLLLLVVIVYYF